LRPELRAARFLGKEAYRLASRPTGASTNPPGGSYRTIGEPAIGAGKPSGKGACTEADLDPTLQDGRPRRVTLKFRSIEAI